MPADVQQGMITQIRQSCAAVRPEKEQIFSEDFGALLNVLLVASAGNGARARFLLNAVQHRVFGVSPEPQSDLNRADKELAPEQRCGAAERQKSPNIRCGCGSLEVV